MFPLPLSAWIGIAGLVAVLGMGGYAKVQSSRLDACKAQSVVIQGKFDGFVAQAKEMGEQQTARAKELDAANEKLKGETDAKLAKSKRDLDGVYSAYRKLRDSRESTNSGTVSSLPVSAGRPDRICFERAKFARAVGDFESGLSGVAQEGDAARLRLASAADWAKSLGSLQQQPESARAP